MLDGLFGEPPILRAVAHLYGCAPGAAATISLFRRPALRAGGPGDFLSDAAVEPRERPLGPPLRPHRPGRGHALLLAAALASSQPSKCRPSFVEERACAIMKQLLESLPGADTTRSGLDRSGPEGRYRSQMTCARSATHRRRGARAGGASASANLHLIGSPSARCVRRGYRGRVPRSGRAHGNALLRRAWPRSEARLPPERWPRSAGARTTATCDDALVRVAGAAACGDRRDAGGETVPGSSPWEPTHFDLSRLVHWFLDPAGSPAQVARRQLADRADRVVLASLGVAARCSADTTVTRVPASAFNAPTAGWTPHLAHRSRNSAMIAAGIIARGTPV